MPELPEVETTCNGIRPYLQNKIITDINVRHYGLRFPVSPDIDHVTKQKIHEIKRRGKYIILMLDSGSLIIHLGMSGCLRILEKNTPPQKHDHIDLHVKNYLLRYTDPRRFGCWIYTKNFTEHSLIKILGPEPLEEQFTAQYLLSKIKNSKRAIKDIIMDSHIVVGVGNIYAAEALFKAKIHPQKVANNLTLPQVKKLVSAIKDILSYAITRGGTTLRDFLASDGKPGYFQQELMVYGRANLPCKKCKTLLESFKKQGRTTVFCSKCQQ